MIKYILGIVFPLLFCAFICVIYRDASNNANALFTYLFDKEFIFIKNTIIDVLPLHDILVYNVPEGLWVFSISLLASNLFININKFRLPLIYLPLLFIPFAELLQWLNITDGTYDNLDMLIPSGFWLLAYLFLYKNNTCVFLNASPIRLYLFFIIACSVYFADVQ